MVYSVSIYIGTAKGHSYYTPYLNFVNPKNKEYFESKKGTLKMVEVCVLQ